MDITMNKQQIQTQKRIGKNLLSSIFKIANNKINPNPIIILNVFCAKCPLGIVMLKNSIIPIMTIAQDKIQNE
jgi:hypothetical protein